MTFSGPSLELARRLLAACETRGLRLATAESCTGGLIVACLTEISGSSSVVERGYVTYDNRAKRELLGVPAGAIERVGARMWAWRSRVPGSPGRAERRPASRSASCISRSPGNTSRA